MLRPVNKKLNKNNLMGIISLLCSWLFIGPQLFNPSPATIIQDDWDSNQNPMENTPIYVVKKLRSSEMSIDAEWEKEEWRNIEAVEIEKQMGPEPIFVPRVQAKLMYDEENIYGIFRVEDRYVRSTVTEYNGNVSGDSCVEFFFSPDAENPLHYFNLEINAGGTPLIFFITKPWEGVTKLEAKDIQQIEIAHSLPEVVDPEITEPTTWFIEFRIPLSMLEKFSNVTRPEKGVVWKGNFYKTGSKTSSPNYLTWSFVDHPKPNFHLPEFFGNLKFE
jgi:hypothetical protein